MQSVHGLLFGEALIAGIENANFTFLTITHLTRNITFSAKNLNLPDLVPIETFGTDVLF